MRYTDEQRAACVLMLEASGYPGQKGALMAVHRKTKIPHTSLRRWFLSLQNPPPSEMVQEKRLSLIELFDNEIRAVFEEMPKARPDASYGQLSVAAGIFTEKMRLLEGNSTSNTAINININYGSADD